MPRRAYDLCRRTVYNSRHPGAFSPHPAGDKGDGMGFREHFSSEVRRLRDEHEMTTRELAAHVGYSYDALKSFLTGHRTPTAKLATGLDRVFNSPGMFATLREEAEADTTPFGELRESEQRAIAIRIWDTPGIPGLLQGASRSAPRPAASAYGTARTGSAATSTSPGRPSRDSSPWPRPRADPEPTRIPRSIP